MNFFSTVADFLKPAPPLDPTVAQALARVGELADPMVRAVAHFERKLSQPVAYALGYCDGLVARLPGPVDINRHAFTADPLIHALFATADDIDQMLGRSQAIRDFLTRPECWESEYFYALFVARRQQKHQLGMARQGEVIRQDVAQQVLFFSNQTLLEPCCHLDITLRRLRDQGLDSLLHSFNAHVDALRKERDGLRADLSVEQALVVHLRGATPGQEYEVRMRHIAELEARLRDTAHALMPEQLLDALGGFLAEPEPALHLKPVTVTIDPLGVLQSPDVADSDVHTLTFPELATRDRRLHLALIARIHRDEARDAVERVRDQQHRFMLL